MVNLKKTIKTKLIIKKNKILGERSEFKEIYNEELTPFGEVLYIKNYIRNFIKFKKYNNIETIVYFGLLDEIKIHFR